MSKELDLNKMNFIDALNKEEEDALFSAMLAKRQKRTEDGLKKLFDAFEKEKEIRSQETEEMRLAIERQKEDAQKQLELERARHRVEESKFGFVTMRNLGILYDVPIGNQKMAKLLKVAGLAVRNIDKRNKGYTAPKMEYIRNGTAVNVPYEGYDAYKWNAEKVIKKIDKWLDSKGFIDDFYKCETQKELYKLIDYIYAEYFERRTK